MQSIVPSSGSTTLILNGIGSPNSENVPSIGVSKLTVGRVLPATIERLPTAEAPCASVTVTRGVNVPAVVYVCEAVAPVASVVPSPSKSHA